MKNRPVRLYVLTLFLLAAIKGIAQPQGPAQSGTIMGDSLVSGKYSLIFASNDTRFDSLTRQNMINVFFTVYPRMVERFNKSSLTKVGMFIDTAYKAVAETGDGVARFNPAWMKRYPQDVDVVTHEVMHVVQDYKGNGPGWLTEGIADYVRYVYGVNNKGAKWFLPDYRPGQSYKDAYRVTARFLLWVEKYKYNKIVDDLDKAMRDGTYTAALWKKLTGQTVDELWGEYAKNPALELNYR
ncbi:MAG TPA: basic secretory protein-like protein [Puia sp.]|nr:basic secretory protein-like protein [Puia sp.]